MIYGRLDSYGKIIIPLEYEYLQQGLNGLIIAKKDGKFGLMTAAQKTIIPFDFDTLIQNRAECFIYKKNGEFGVNNMNFESLVPPEFDRIEHVWQNKPINDARYDDLYYSKQYFYVYKDSLCGIYKAGEGLIVPCRYESIDPNFDYYENDLEIIHYYTVYFQRQNNTVKPRGNEEFESVNFQSGIVNKQGKLIVGPNSNSQYVELFSIRTDGTFADGFVLTREKTGFRAYNLNTGEKSELYKFIFKSDAGLIGYNLDEWSLLNNSLEPIHFFDKYWFNYLSDYDTSFAEIKIGEIYTDLSGWGTELEYEYKLLYLTKDFNAEKNYSDQMYKGLLNLKTGKMIKVDYDELMIFPFEDNFCVWALTYQDKKNKTNLQIDVYNHKFKRINKIQGINRLKFSIRDIYQIVPVMNEDWQMALYSANGEQLTAYDYEEIDYPLIYSFDPPLTSAHWIVLTDSKTHKKGVFNYKGEELLPCAYDYIGDWENEVLWVSKDNKYTLYDRHFIPLLENYDLGVSGNPIDSVGQIILEHNRFNQRNRAYYMFKDSLLYCYFEGKVEQIVPMWMPFENGFTVFDIDYDFSILMNEKGKIVNYKPDYKIEPTEYGFIMIESYRKHYYKIDFTGNIFDEYQEKNKPFIPHHVSVQQKPAVQVIQGYHPSTISGGVFYWKLDKEGWHLYNDVKEKWLTIDFTYPLFIGQNTNVFQSQNNFGILGDDYQLKLNAEYSYIYQNKQLCFVEQGSQWGMYNLKNDSLIQPIFDEIMVETIAGRFVVFKAHQLAIYDENLKVVLDFVDTTKAIDSLDLNLYFKGGNTYNYFNDSHWSIIKLKFDPISAPYSNDAYRILNNRRIIDLAHQFSTKNAIMQIQNCHNPNYGSYKTQVSQACHVKRNYMKTTTYSPQFSNAHFYSESIGINHYTFNVKLGNLPTDCGNSVYFESSSFNYMNYKIVDQKFYPATLDDLIKTDEKSRDKLNELLIDELNRTQILGYNCPDIAFYLKDMVDHFSLSNQGVYFFVNQRGQYSEKIFISYQSLSEVLLKPQWFL